MAFALHCVLDAPACKEKVWAAPLPPLKTGISRFNIKSASNQFANCPLTFRKIAFPLLRQLHLQAVIECHNGFRIHSPSQFEQDSKCSWIVLFCTCIHANIHACLHVAILRTTETVQTHQCSRVRAGFLFRAKTESVQMHSCTCKFCLL